MNVTRFLWVRIPLLAARYWPGAGIVLGDGHYLGRWPYVAIPAIPLACAGGVVVGAMHEGRTFTYSMIVMAVFAVAGQAGAGLGLWATIGYAVGDLFLNSAPRPGNFFTATVPDLLSYVLLGLLAVVLPVAVLWMRRAMPVGGRLPAKLMPWLEGLCAALIAGAGAFLWAKAVPLLIQPIFNWVATEPGEKALAPLRDNWWVLVLAAAWAAVARVVAEREAVAEQTIALSQELWDGLLDRLDAGPRTGIPGLIAVGLGAAGGTLMVSGLVDKVWQAIVVLLFLASLLFVRLFLISTETAVVGLLTRVPLPFRLLAAALLALGASRLVLGFLTSHTSGQAPILLSVCLAALLLTLLTLPRRIREEFTDSSAPPAW